MRERFPDITEDMSVVIQALPLRSSVACWPFTGIVLNIGVSTNGHRDTLDLSLCLVLPIGEWTGGQLCMYELGLCFDLQNGDIVVFKSDMLTHFNLLHKGLRCSMVLHADKHLMSWAKNRNGHKSVIP